MAFRNTILAAALLVGTSMAGAQTRFVTFGDSLSDNGNLFAITGARPTGPYAAGTFSNGPVWITQIAGPQAGFTGGATPAGSLNFAFGGSRTDTLATPGPGTATQVGAFFAGGGRFAPTDVATMWAGANDIFQGLPVAAATPATAQATMQAIATSAAGNVAGQVGQLAAAGARTIVVVNLPDFSGLPQFIAAGGATQQLAGFSSSTFNSVLQTALANAAAANPNTRILQVNASSLFQAVTANPAAFGFSNVTQACVLLASCAGFAFFDGVHPTTAGHALIAQTVTQFLNAPERALAAAAITEIGLSSRRSAAYRALERLAGYQPRTGVTDIYVSLIGDHANHASRGAAPGYHVTTGGVELGIIRHVSPTFSLAGAFSVQTGSASTRGLGNRLEFNPTSFNADLLARWLSGPVYVQGSLGASASRTSEISRTLGFGGLENKASTTGRAFSAMIEAGYNHAIGGFTLTPSARFGYLYAGTDGFSEAGVVAPIRYSARNVATFVAAAEIKGTFKVSDMLSAHALIGYELYFGQSNQQFRGAIVGSPGSDFARRVGRLESPGVTFGAGLTGAIGPVPVTAEYRGSVDADGRTRHRGTISARIGF